MRTVNRVPAQVQLPSKSDIKQYFFNHYNWKGLNDDKNFLTADQESFSDCDNVYVDEEGLLRSRPSVKPQKLALKVNGNDYILSDILDVWNFERVTVYKSYQSQANYYYLVFHNKDFVNSIILQLTYTDSNNDVQTYSNIKLVVADNKIFVFSEHTIAYYDIVANTFGQADSFIHIPITKILVDGIEDSESNPEYPNELTTSYITRYVYTSIDNPEFSMFIGKTVTVKLDDEEYEVEFSPNEQYTFVNKFINLQDDNFSDDCILGKNGQSYPLIKIADRSILICSYEYTVDTNNKNPTITWNIYHTVDGIIFNKLDAIDDILGMPIISEDGIYCIVFKADGPYIISLLKSVGDVYKYPTWTNLLDTLNSTTYSSWNLNLNQKYTSSSKYNQNVSINGYFVDDTVFAFVYGDTPKASTEEYPIYKNLYCIFSDGSADGVNTAIFKTAIFKNEDSTISPHMAYTAGFMPNVCAKLVSNSYLEILVNHMFINTSNEFCNALHIVKRYSGITTVTLNTYDNITFEMDSNNYCRSPINNALIITDTNMLYAYIISVKYPSYYDVTYHVRTMYLNGDPSVDKYVLRKSVTSTDISSILDLRFCINKNLNLFVDNKLFLYTSYTYDTYDYVSLLFNMSPVSYITTTTMYAISNNILYTNDKKVIQNFKVSIFELTEGEYNYLLPEHVEFLDNYYFSKGNTLYISAPGFDKITKEFEWYFPTLNTEVFEYNVTNLHVISDVDVAIFFEHFVNYVRWDNDFNSYRYYKSKIQTGCREGCDVLTTYDGKYVVFTSERGLVALTSQEFMATTEQAITYLSDSIFTMFKAYINESTSTNDIKLVKHAYWIIAYKPDSKLMFLLDVRNNSWWKFTLPKNVTKIVRENDELETLLDAKMYSFDKSEINYKDYLTSANRSKIDWFIKSQKLYLQATNYYKHIVNMTFISTHDDKLLESAIGNFNEFNCKLQINAYKDRLVGNIDTNNDISYAVMNYVVNAARTFVQRLNYLKVNEFEYKLSADMDNATPVPLSINNITVKYKIGSMVR